MLKAWLRKGAWTTATCNMADNAIAPQSQRLANSCTKALAVSERVKVTGQFTAYFQDATLRDLFINETESQLAVALTADNTAAAAFVAFVMSRIKVGGASKTDGEGGLVQTFPNVAANKLYTITEGAAAPK